MSASKAGFFADTGASFLVSPARTSLDRLCKDGKRAMQVGISQVGHDKPLAGIGRAIGQFASARGYTLIRNLASHGVGRSLHEYPEEIATWPIQGDKRGMHKGMVLTAEPFLSTSGVMASDGDDGWTLYSHPRSLTVQYEHTVVATHKAPIIVTMPG